MIPKEGGDATPLGQRLLSVLPIVYSFSATVPLSHIQDWFESLLPESVFSVGRGRSSVDSWYTTALDKEECLGSEEHDHVHIFVADGVESFDTVDRNTLTVY